MEANKHKARVTKAHAAKKKIASRGGPGINVGAREGVSGDYFSLEMFLVAEL